MMPRYGHQFRQLSGMGGNDPSTDMDWGDRMLRQARRGNVQFDEAGHAAVNRPDGFSADVSGGASDMLRKVQEMYAHRRANRPGRMDVRGTGLEPMPAGGPTSGMPEMQRGPVGAYGDDARAIPDRSDVMAQQADALPEPRPMGRPMGRGRPLGHRMMTAGRAGRRMLR